MYYTYYIAVISLYKCQRYFRVHETFIDCTNRALDAYCSKPCSDFFIILTRAYHDYMLSYYNCYSKSYWYIIHIFLRSNHA